MPTSSQALLLKHSDGALHQTFGRPYWHPDQSHLDDYTKPEFIQNSFLSSKQRRKSPQRIPTTVPTKTQNVRYDFQSLPELLQINGIHGSLSFDESTNSLRVTVPSYHQNALRNTHKNWRLTLSNDNTIQPTTLWSSIRHLRGIMGEGNERRIDSDDNSDVLSHEIQDPKHRAQNKGNELIKMKVTEGETIKMVNVPTKDADYFHLIQETADGVFRLVKANPKDAGSFRLEGTMATDVGDFRLVPEDGFECDDFRLVIVDADNAHFRLLQADPIDGKWFKPIIMSTKSDGEFRLVQAAVDAKYAANQESIGQNCDKDATKWNRAFNSHQKKLSVTRELVRLRERDNGLAEFVNAPVEYADYFRLVQESSDGVFRLSKSHPEDERSFRLTWTRPDELGDFRLISADGLETDDYRLVSENTGHGQFRLLKADSLDGKSFRFVAMSKESDGLFRLPEVKLRENVQTYSESPSSIEGNVAQEIRTSKMVKLHRSNNSVGKSHRYRSVQDEGTDNVTDNLVFLRSVVVEDESVDCASLPPALPDIALYDPRYLTGTQKLKTMHNSKRHLQSSRKAVSEVEVLQHGRSNFDSLTQYRGQQQRQFNLNDKGAMQTDGVRDRNLSELTSRSSSDNGMDAFREKFIDSYREASPETYEKLIKLGFRPTNEVMVNQEGFKFDSLDGRLRSKPLSPKDPFRNNPYITTSFNERESTHDHYGVAGTISNDSMARELKRCVNTAYPNTQSINQFLIITSG